MRSQLDLSVGPKRTREQGVPFQGRKKSISRRKTYEMKKDQRSERGSRSRERNEVEWKCRWIDLVVECSSRPALGSYLSYGGGECRARAQNRCTLFHIFLPPYVPVDECNSAAAIVQEIESDQQLSIPLPYPVTTHQQQQLSGLAPNEPV